MDKYFLIEITGLPGVGKSSYLKVKDFFNYNKVFEPDKTTFFQKVNKILSLFLFLLFNYSRCLTFLKIIYPFVKKSKFLPILISFIWINKKDRMNKSVYDEYYVHFLFKLYLRSKCEIDVLSLFDFLTIKEKRAYYIIEMELDLEEIKQRLLERSKKKNITNHLIIQENLDLETLSLEYKKIISILINNHRIQRVNDSIFLPT
jgi:hypothetical protein